MWIISDSELDSVDFIGPYGDLHSEQLEVIIDEIVMYNRDVFREASGTKLIALSEIRKVIVPTIRQIVEQPSLFDILASLQAKDDYLYRHSIAVSLISALFGKWLKFSESDLLQLITAAVLHDIGKTQIPIDILNKPDKLTTEEFDVMKRHTLHGYSMIKNTVGITHRQALVALQHHERIDGSGYPFGLHNEQIDVFSRIVAIADVFHSMSSKRVYRDPSPFYDVLKQIDNNAYGELDPGIVHLLVDKIMQALIGYEVKLTDGRKGKIVMINPHDALRPLVHIGDNFVDLSKQLSIQIEYVLASE